MARARALLAALGLGATLVLAAAPLRAQDADARTSVAGLRSRIAELEERAERAGATSALDHARRALVEADRRRALEDDVGAARAEAIAGAALRVAERRVEAARARADRDAARARLTEAEARAAAARQALERARIEHARLEEAREAPASEAEGAAAQEDE